MTQKDAQPELIEITKELTIPAAEIRFQFSRSGGPGGQNVNRRQTRVELLFDVRNSPSLSEEQRAQLLQRLVRKIDQEGVLRIVVQTQRSQLRNRQTALQRFVLLLRRSLLVGKPRLTTGPSRQSAQQRLERKHRRSEIKQHRQHIGPDDFS